MGGHGKTVSGFRLTVFHFVEVAATEEFGGN
jgi:hypothetical protein